MNSETDAWRQRALQLLDETTPTSWPPADADPRPLGWALKELCYESWSADPPRAVAAAGALRRLADAQARGSDARVELDALALWTAGLAAVIQGRLEAALAAFDGAAAGLRCTGLADPAAQTQVPKIMVLSMLGRHAEAATCAESAQRELRSLGNLRAASRVSQNLGGLHFLRDAYPEAAHHFREAAVLFARLGDADHSVLADIGLADALTAMGDFDEAMRIFARARMRAGQRGFELRLAQLDESVALLEQARGRYREALAGLESARRRYATLGVPQYVAVSEKELGDAYLDLRLLPEAWRLLDAAVSAFASLSMPDEQAWALAQRGRAEALSGQESADASFLASAQLFEAQGNRAGAAAVRLARAELALARGDPEVGLTEARHAAAEFADADHAAGRARAEVTQADALLASGRVVEAREAYRVALEHARAQQRGALETRCLTGLGLADQQLGDAAAAATAFETAIERFEELRQALPGDDIRRAFLIDHLRPYHERLRAVVAAGSAHETLWQLERFRARALDDRLSEAFSPPGADEALLRERLDWLYRRHRRQEEEGQAADAPGDEMRRLEGELLERARRRRLVDPARRGEADGFGIEALQAALGAEDALIEYGVVDGALFACVVTREAVELIPRMAAWSEVIEAVRSVRFQVETLSHGVAPVRRHLDALVERTRRRLAHVHERVWAPVAEQVRERRRLLVVPHGVLGALPFAALDDHGVVLGQRFELAFAPSARVALRGLRRPSALPRRVIALGESSTLPHAAVEAERVARMFEHGEAFPGDRATVAALRAHGPGADVLHFAAHAEFRRDNPRHSALHLHDGAITAEDAEGLALGPGLVVLSACETGLADDAVGDERVGLVRAFLAGGAARVVASQWPVDDAVTLALMTRFYAALTAGAGPAAALREAQGATLQAHPHPGLWASFTLHGGW